MNNPAAELYQALGQLSHDYPVLPGMDKMLDKALAAADLIDELAAHQQALVGALTNAHTALQVADFTTGTCGCGDGMAGHSYTSGHAPVDEGDYYRSQLLEGCQKALEAVPEVILAEVRALAARNGFIAGADWGHAAERLDPGVMSAANHYSNCIRQGAKS